MASTHRAGTSSSWYCVATYYEGLFTALANAEIRFGPTPSPWEPLDMETARCGETAPRGDIPTTHTAWSSHDPAPGRLPSTELANVASPKMKTKRKFVAAEAVVLW